jgi:hypothetical protein
MLTTQSTPATLFSWAGQRAAATIAAAGNDAHDVVCGGWGRRYRVCTDRVVHCDPISRCERAYIEATSMVNSSRPDRGHQRRCTFEVTATRLACDADRMRCNVYGCGGRRVVVCSNG